MNNRAKIREKVKYLNPIDDIMFCKMAEDKEFCEEILRVILSDSKLIVESSSSQYNLKNLQGRSVVLDAYCIMGDGTKVEIEVQKENNDNHQKRVRYNGSVLTANILDPGEKFENVPNICIVFISKFDLFKGNLPLYHIDRVVRETKEIVDNGLSEIYVNTKVKDGSLISELMDVFVEDNAYSSNFPITSEIKHRYKETEEGVDIMCEIVEKIREEGKIEGKAEGKAEGKIEILCSLVKEGILSLAEAAKRADMSETAFASNMENML